MISYYEATKPYSKWGLVAPWYFRVVGFVHKPDNTTDIDVEIGYSPEPMMDTVNVSGHVPEGAFLSALADNENAYREPVGPTDGPSFPEL